MFQKIQNSWELAKSSARVLEADKELLVFPLLSGAALILVTASFFVPTLIFGASMSHLAQGAIGPAGFVLLFAFYVVQYFVIIFFNSALIGAAMMRLEGGNPTLQDGLRVAWSRVGSIFGYAMIAATVGMVLRAARERSGVFGKIVIGLIGMGWSLATFLVVPVLVVRGLGPIDAIKESTRILKSTWGEQIAGNVGLSILFAVLGFGLVILAVPTIIFAVSIGQPILIGAVVVLWVLAFLLLSLVSSALQGIYQAAVYRFATTGEAGWGFERGQLAGAFDRS